MLRLEGVVRDYAWGDRDAIPRLLGEEPTGAPQAELWLGAHPQAPATVDDGRGLDAVIAADPQRMLGATATRRFGELPFLPKLLAAAAPLSIQTHPDEATARVGFAREEAAGIPRDAAERIYRDPHHKPELLCALSSFEALCGFRGVDEVAETIDVLGGPFAALVDVLGHDGLDGVLGWLLRAGTDQVAHLVARARELVAPGRPAVPGVDPRWWGPIAERYPEDPGSLVALLLLRHLRLAPGEAIFLGPGNLHAYLRGTAVEVMANSDNVVRGGLTPKHIDVDELLRLVDTGAPGPVPQRPGEPAHDYDVPVEEFGLRRIRTDDPDRRHALGGGPAVVVVVDGDFRLHVPGADLDLARGAAVFVPAADGEADAAGAGTLFRVAVGAA